MKRNEWLFLAAVLACALVFATAALDKAHRPLAPDAGVSPPGRAGRPRDVDLDKVRRLIEQRSLSDHEAAYYTPFPEPSGEESLSPDTP